MKALKHFIKRHRIFIVVTSSLVIYGIVAHIYKSVDLAPIVESSYLLTEITKETREL